MCAISGGQTQGTVNGEGVDSLQRETQSLRTLLTEKEELVEKLVSLFVWSFFSIWVTNRSVVFAWLASLPESMSCMEKLKSLTWYAKFLNQILSYLPCV